MERQFPKNVKQIGNVSDEPKIYVEDYVDTYLGQLKEMAGKKPAGAFLTGEILTLEGQAVVFVSGAIQMKQVEIEGTEIRIGEDVLAQAEEDRMKYFPSSEIVGWCLVSNGRPFGMIRETVRLHEKIFTKEHSVFVWADLLEEDDIYYAYKYGELMQMGGHFIYYERNPAMQNYMIGVRRKIGVTPSEMVEDRAAKDFRLAVREQMSEKKQHNHFKAAYVSSVFLLIVVLVIGVTAINNYDKMESVQGTLETLSQKTSGTQEQANAESTSEEVSKTLEEEASQPSEKVIENKPEENETAETIVYLDESQLTEDDYYTVQKGDTLDSISRAVYGDSSEVDAICRMNGLSDGNLIYVGQKLLLP